MEEERTMVTFTVGPWRFTYRVGAIVLREEHVLLTRNLSESYWFTPGGRVEIGESAHTAIDREIYFVPSALCPIRNSSTKLLPISA